MINDFVLLRFRARAPEDLSAIKVIFIIIIIIVLSSLSSGAAQHKPTKLHSGNFVR